MATPDAKFGMPVARTPGYLFSPLNVARLRKTRVHQHVRRMLLLAQIMDDDDAPVCGFLNEISSTGAGHSRFVASPGRP